MSEHAIRSAVPPRDLAAIITARSVLRAGWAVALVYLTISVLVIVDTWISRSYPPTVLISLGALVLVIVALILLIRRPTPLRGALYLAVGTVACFVYDYALLLADPSLDENGTYLVNRVTIALVLVGAVGKRLIGGVLWCTVGCVLGSAATAAAQLSLGLKPDPGFGPIATLVIYVIILLMFVLIRRSQRRFTPDFSAVEAETARMAGRRELEERAVALLHDTVLNDLAALVHGKDDLDDRARARIVRDIVAVTSAQLNPEASPHSSVGSGNLRNELLAVMSEFQWQGLTVDVSGGDALSVDLDPTASVALIGAVSGCLENIVRHSGSNFAEVFIDATEERLSVMIVDHGRGFDPASVPGNRLGIRGSLIQRIESCGGEVRIWSAVGSGTSIIIAVPIAVRHD